MKRTFSCIAVLLGVFPFATFATDYAFQLVTAPGYTQSYAYEINNSGAVLVGAGSGEASFLRDPSGGLTQIDYSNHTPTVALGINNHGVIIGQAYNASTGDYFGFIRETNGTFSDFTYPGAVGPEGGFQADGINDSGVIVGGFVVNSTNRGAFI